jgi:hypothetical protein
MRNPFAPDFNKMFGGERPDNFVINADVVCVEIWESAIDQDERRTGFPQGPQHCRRRSRGSDNQ